LLWFIFIFSNDIKQIDRSQPDDGHPWRHPPWIQQNKKMDHRIMQPSVPTCFVFDYDIRTVSYIF